MKRAQYIRERPTGAIRRDQRRLERAIDVAFEIGGKIGEYVFAFGGAVVLIVFVCSFIGWVVHGLATTAPHP